MILRQITSIWVAFVILWGVSKAQHNINFQRLSIEHGLSQSTVLSILQDEQGFMWFGTHDGLNRYNGYNFTVFKNNPFDSTSISDNIIVSLCETSDGTLWVGTLTQGLNRFDRYSESFTRYIYTPDNSEGIVSNRITSIIEDGQNNLWLGSDRGVCKYNPRTNIFEKNVSFNVGFVNDLATDGGPKVWIGSSLGLFCADITTGNITQYGNFNGIVSLALGKDSDIWVGTVNGLFHYSIPNNTFVTYRRDEKNIWSICSNSISQLLFDNVGKLWIGTNNGLSIMDIGNGRCRNFKHSQQDVTSLHHNNISYLYQDDNGIVWIGAWERGASSYDRLRQKFKLYKQNPWYANTLPDKTVRAIFKENAKRLWLGYVEGGLVDYDRTSGNCISYQADMNDPKSLADNTVTAILRRQNGELWVGTSLGGLHKALFLSNDSGKIAYFERYRADKGMPYFQVQGLLEDSKKRLWVVTENGVALYDDLTDKFTTIPNLEGKVLQCITEDQQRNIWIGSFGEGLFRLTATKKGFKTTQFLNNINDTLSLSDNRVISLLSDHNGVLWVGTFGSGINKITAVAPDYIRCKRYNTNNGLANNVVYGILEDENTNIWVSTNKGVTLFDRATNVFTTYDKSDGLQYDEFFWGAYYKGNDGELFFGGTNGFNAFYPNDISNNPHAPPVVITEFSIFNKQVRIGKNTALKKSIIYTDTIVLSYSQKVLSFRFAALHYSAAEKNRYAYRLEGFADEWTYLEAGVRSVSFTNLDPGEYKLHVIASNNDGIWNREGKTIVIIIEPPFWKTWLFRVIAVVLAIAVAVIFMRNKTRKLQEQKRELEQKVVARTFEIQMKNDELSYQKREIEIQRDEIDQHRKELEFQRDTVVQQRDHIADQNRKITDSLRYAGRIQKAVLPSHDLIKSLQREYFIWYQPKAIVSGDFYWAKQTNEYFQLAVADCTGHGVPGGFMSMLGIAFLNDITGKNPNATPNLILEQLREYVKQALRQNIEEREHQDGMDIGFCSINVDKLQLLYAAAHQSALVVRNNEIIEIKADRQPIGVYRREAPFTLHTFNLEPNDILYLFSDGFTDQLNESGVKLLLWRFKEFLKTHSHSPLALQQQLLLDVFNNWRGKQEQVDDILMIAIKF